MWGAMAVGKVGGRAGSRMLWFVGDALRMGALKEGAWLREG